MTKLILNKHPVVRAAHYLFLLPFGVALWPLVTDFRILDFIIYSVGFALVLFLIIYGNHRPLLTSDKHGFHLYLHHGRKAEFCPFRHIASYHLMTNSRISITPKNDLPIILFLGRKNLKKLTDVLEIESIHENSN